MHNKSTTVRFIRAVAPIVATLAPGLAARWLERLFLTPPRWPAPPREQAWMRGTTGQWLRLDATRRLWLQSVGTGPAVLLLHGWAGRGSQLGAFVQPLAARGFRVVIVDAPGHGGSDGRLTGLPEFALALEAVARSAGPLAGIVAHSLGAAACTVALARGLDARSVVYLAPPEEPGGYLRRAARFLGFGDGIAERTQARIERRFGFRFVDARGSQLAAGLRVPLLAIHDREDEDVAPAEGARLVASWPGARLVTTAGLGHTRLLRDPAVVAAAVDFVETAGVDGAEGQLATRPPRANVG